MARQSDFDLDADEIVTAAVEIFEESGLDAVSMRSVSARLGVSPVPLYSRIGNKDALVDAIADRLLADLAPPGADGRAVGRVRGALGARAPGPPAPGPRQPAHPLARAATPTSRRRARWSTAMRRDGFAADAAVQACRLLMWATVGFGAVESGRRAAGSRRRRGSSRRRSGGRRRGRGRQRCSTSTSAT